MGNVPLNYALRHSMNAVPVRLIEKVGIEESYKFLTKKLQFKHLVKSDKNAASLALGGCTYGITPIESASAFAIYGSDGIYHEPTTYYKIVDTDGEVILEQAKGKRVISSATATIMNHLLQEVVYKDGGTGRSISGFNYRMKAYAKTGTSSDTKDSWLVGGTPYYVGAVWYGFDHNQRVYNTSAAKTVWRDIMREIHEDLEPIEFKDSEDVYRRGSGYYKNGTNPGLTVKEEDYLPDDEEEELTESDTSSGNTSSVTSSTISSPQDTTSSTTSDTQNGDTSSDNTSTEAPDGTESTPSGDTPSTPSTDTPPTNPDENTPSQDTGTSSDNTTTE
jgi:penicillin-binding protein 1A